MWKVGYCIASLLDLEVIQRHSEIKSLIFFSPSEVSLLLCRVGEPDDRAEEGPVLECYCNQSTSSTINEGSSFQDVLASLAVWYSQLNNSFVGQVLDVIHLKGFGKEYAILRCGKFCSRFFANPILFVPLSCQTKDLDVDEDEKPRN